MRAVLVGNYGVGNLGDEALEEYFLESFPDIQWSVVSARPSGPHELPRLPLGLHSLFMTAWWRTVGCIRHADCVVFGGGTLFTDVESARACLLWGLHALIARAFHRPILPAFQGIGPFRTSVGEWIACRVARSSEQIIVRDDQSFDRVNAWKLHTEIVRSFDPILSQIHQQSAERSHDVLVIIPRRNASESFWQSVDQIRESTPWQTIRIVSLQPGNPEERKVVAKLQATIGASVEVRPVFTLSDLIDGLSGAGHVITQRYHGAIAALALGIPQTIVPQAEGDKLSEIAALLKEKSPDQVCAELRKQVSTGEESLTSALSRLSP